MTRTKLELREKANIEKYIHNNTEVCVDAIMELYNRIPDIGGVFKSLFRYRPLNSYELDSLENETIFMRWPSSYEDEDDCTPVFNLKEISQYIIKKNHPALNTEKVFDAFVDVDDIMSNDKVKAKVNDMRDMWMIACFTETHDNKKMWLRYADNSTGICLVYSFYEVLNAVKAIDGMSIMPVRYVDNREQYSDICLNHKDLLDPDDESEAKYQLTCTTKERLKYSFEEEWRLIYERAKEDADGEKIGDSIPFIKPALIICGDLLNRKSSEYQRLVEIAKEKNITVL